MVRIGIDVGSTTLKCVVLNNNNEILYSDYQRHYSQISQKLYDMLCDVKKNIKDSQVTVAISGSAGMGYSKDMDIPFAQEVYATRLAVKTLNPETDVVIELGGEDAKILFLSDTLEIRMNGSCAGGTGAFIDQMATLLHTTPTEMNELAKESSKIYTIASRCGVFAKSDVQPLLNQGARKEDISASIFYAVVNQTISGLAQGRKIEGNVMYLGGPLTFFSELRNSFDKTLNTKAVFPENSLYFVAIGTALTKDVRTYNIDELINSVKNFKANVNFASCEPLFNSQEEYDSFAKKHEIGKGIKLHAPSGNAFIGIDAGSTTLKAVLINENDEIIHYRYTENGGTPVPLVKFFLQEVYEKFPNINISAVATTGYGEEIVKRAFKADYGVIETMAHFTAAKKFNPDVDFIIDIGGQDIKCFKIRNSAIDNIFLNEACSSGCGSFLQTFSAALGEDIESFSKKGLFAKKPVDLGSRCTVFMNSSIKQAQKDGVEIENISAGLSISVVKNALYKVIRIANADNLGKNIVVQGGTFLNDAVLRAFEKELGINVIRPAISGLMGAYGAALYAKQKKSSGKSGLIGKVKLENFVHEVKAITCKGCQNNCKLTVNTFEDGEKFIGGNRCEVPLKLKNSKEKYNIYDYKTELLNSYKNCSGTRETIGIPFVLNMYELLPFWHKFFTELGFGVHRTSESTRKLYLKGQQSIPSDTVCYPAKLIHGHIECLLEEKINTIFYPCMTYNFDEKMGDNNYNCPVVAYYPEVISANISELDNIKFINNYVGIHRRKDFSKKMQVIFKEQFGANIALTEVQRAADFAYLEYQDFMNKIREKGKEYLNIAKEKNQPVIVLCGRPYHLDAEINHGIDKLICDHDAVLVTEDAVCYDVEKPKTAVLNQWTYHSRMYAAAKYVADSDDKNLNLIQLVSFGCGVDSITTDEMRKILEEKNKIYTQIKIDEITNLGAVKIRLRSLFAATGLED